MPRRHAGWGAMSTTGTLRFPTGGPARRSQGRTHFFPNLLLITFAISGTVGPCAKQPTSTLREAADLHQLREAGNVPGTVPVLWRRAFACLRACLLVCLHH